MTNPQLLLDAAQVLELAATLPWKRGASMSDEDNCCAVIGVVRSAHRLFGCNQHASTVELVAFRELTSIAGTQYLPGWNDHEARDAAEVHAAQLAAAKKLREEAASLTTTENP